LKVLSAEFVTSAAAGGRRDGLPHDGLAQVALAGRSNVGKSSLLNALCRAKVARTSAAPGKTRLANVYRVAAEGGPGGAGRWAMYFVDLPGYGYARGGAASAEELRLVAEAYLGAGRAPDARREDAAADGPADLRQEQGRERHEGPSLVLLLVDARHPGLESDLAAGRWLATLGVSPFVVATKIDKLTRSERVRNLKAIDGMFGTAALPVSALRGEGLDELWTTIAKIARDGDRRGPASPPPGERQQRHRSSS
jgi:GTP-binding protein